MRTWYVTARHAVDHPRRRGRNRPFGEAHVRQVGAALTACGLPSGQWVMFWTLTFADLDRLCATCAVVGHEDLGRKPSSSSGG